MPACGPRRGSIDGLVRPTYSTSKARPSGGAKPREAGDIKTSGGSGLPGLPPVERRFLCRCPPHEVEVTQAMTTKARRAPAGAEQQVSSLVLRRQAQVRGPEESPKGFHSRATRPRLPGRMSLSSPPRRHDQKLYRRRPLFVRIGCTTCPLSNWPLWDPFPPTFWGRGPRSL